MPNENTLSEEQRKNLTPEEIANFEEVVAIEEGDDDPDASLEADAAAAKAAEEAAATAKAEAEKKAKEEADAADAEAEKNAAKDKADTPPADPPAEQDPPAAEAPPAPVTVQPASFPTFEKPEGADERITEIDTSLEDLAVKMDDGEITAQEYHQQSRELNKERHDWQKKIDRHEMSVEALAQNALDQKTAFDNANNTFLETHAEEYPVGSDSFAMLNGFVMQMQKTTGVEDDPSYITEAHKKVEQLLGGKTNDDPVPVPKPGARPDPPPTLGKVPAASVETTDDGKFVHLDRLDGEELEKAVSKLTPEQQEEYSQRA